VVDLDAFDKKPDQIALQRPIQSGHALLDLFCKIFEPTDEERQGSAQGGLVLQGGGLLFPDLDPLSQPCDPLLEFVFFDQTLGIAIDESGDAAAQLGDLRFGSDEIGTIGVRMLGLVQPPLVLGRDQLGVVEEPLHFLPDRRVGAIGPQLRVGAQALTAKAMGIAAAAAVVGIVAPLSFCRPRADRLVVIGIAAPPAHQQSLQEIALTAAILTVALAVLGKLFLNGGEQLGFDEGGNRHPQPFLLGHIIGVISPAGLFRAPAYRPRPLAPRSDPGLAKGRRADIGGVLENPPHRRPIPGRLAAAGQATLLAQPPTDFADTDTLAADPRKHQTNDGGLRFVNGIAGHAAALMFANIIDPLRKSL
jgi:hypothetical protein